MAFQGTVLAGQPVCNGLPGVGCEAANIIAPKVPTKYHDEALQRCTKEINDILQRVASMRTDRVLRFFTTPDGLVLAWAIHEEFVDLQSEPDQIRRALGLV